MPELIVLPKQSATKSSEIDKALVGKNAGARRRFEECLIKLGAKVNTTATVLETVSSAEPASEQAEWEQKKAERKAAKAQAAADRAADRAAYVKEQKWEQKKANAEKAAAADHNLRRVSKRV
eukprot:COSAG06_NODE_44127_length_366_cov_0.569288_1_plen_121_part_11